METAIEVQADRSIGVINPDIYGHFLELAFDCFYGGLWAEMLTSRKFEADDGEGDQYGVVRPWFPIGRTQNTHFMHDNTVFYCGNQSQRIESEEHLEHEIGIGQGGLYLEKRRTYQLRLNLRQEEITTPIVVALKGTNSIYACREIVPKGTDWSRFTFDLQPSQTDREGILTITFRGPGKLWLGTASLMPDDHLSGYRSDVVEALGEIKPPNIRWPGGNFVSYYHWEDGIGDRDRRPPRPNYARSGVRGDGWQAREQWEPNDVGIDEFMELCRLTGARPYVAVNAGDGTPEEAAHLVEYCNGSTDTEYGAKRAANGRPEPYDVQLWGIGNESFGNWQGGHVDEETYARRHLAIGKAMRKIDPAIKLVAAGGRNWFYRRWNQALFRIARGYIDYLSLHSYAKKYRPHMKKEDLEDPDFALEFYDYIVSSPYGVEEQIQLTGQEIRTANPEGPEIPVAFDEWNCWAYRAPDHYVEFAVRDGIYTAGMLHAFRRQCDVVNLANFSMTVNCLAMIRVNRFGLFFNPQYLVFKMYMHHQGQTLLESAIECESFPAPEYEQGRPQARKRIPYLDASATMSFDGEIVYLAVVNRHRSETIHSRISIVGWRPDPQGLIIRLEGEHFMDENTFEDPDRIWISEKPANDFGQSFFCDFPKHSVTILQLHKHERVDRPESIEVEEEPYEEVRARSPRDIVSRV
ncbi:MAG: hypothetical protein JSU77_09650 [Fidelibacterota bacterium]|nr:MAG: hypothetical protein JSU77_09650 [Candidatus Neomarinimicrobiota bacterium]